MTVVTMQGRQSLCDSFDKANTVVLSIRRVHFPRPRLHVLLQFSIGKEFENAYVISLKGEGWEVGGM